MARPQYHLALLLLLTSVAPLQARQDRGLVAGDPAASAADTLETPSLAADPERVRALAWSDTAARVIVSVEERRLWWVRGGDTLLTAPVGVGKGTLLHAAGETWDFITPAGVRHVLGKTSSPVWVPPEWHYVELARDSALQLVHLPPGGTRLPDGSRVVVRGDRVGRQFRDGHFEAVPADEEVVFGDTLFVPPFGTVNRQIAGELGQYALDIGDGFRIHGTPEVESIGKPATHGCIRAADDAIRRLYDEVPVGTTVYIY